jgi:hypothetical protein
MPAAGQLLELPLGDIADESHPDGEVDCLSDVVGVDRTVTGVPSEAFTTSTATVGAIVDDHRTIPETTRASIACRRSPGKWLVMHTTSARVSRLDSFVL